MAENLGKVVQVIGPTVDCEFPSDSLPNILNAIKIKDPQAGSELTVEVAMHIGDNVVRCVALASTDGLVRGMTAVDTGAPISVPVGEVALGRIFNLLGEPLDPGDPIPADAKRWEMRFAARISFEHVKQWANMAVASIEPFGVSNLAASSSPEWPLNVSLSLGIENLLIPYAI